MQAPPGDELNTVFAEQKVELHPTCVLMLDMSVSTMRDTVRYRFRKNANSLMKHPERDCLPVGECGFGIIPETFQRGLHIWH
jgi:hypothetical protein